MRLQRLQREVAQEVIQSDTYVRVKKTQTSCFQDGTDLHTAESATLAILYVNFYVTMAHMNTNTPLVLDFVLDFGTNHTNTE